MERKAYPVDEKLFDLLSEENFEKLNTDELQKLFDNSDYEISDKWVFISDKIEREYQKESEDFEIRYFFHFSRLYGYKYFSLIDYGNNATYKIGIPDVSRSDDGMNRQKCVIIIQPRGKVSRDMIDLKKYVFNRLADGTQISNYLINNIEQILMQSFTEFFHAEFDQIQNRVEPFKKANSLTEDKNPFFITYNVDPEQSQNHKHVVAEKFRILKGIIDINIKEVFFKPYTDKDIIALINIELKTMDLVRAINEYMRADASLYLEWGDPVRYNRFDSQILSQYREKEVDKDNIKNVERLISSELLGFSGDWYDNESLILLSKNSFYFRSRQLINKASNLLGNFMLFIKNTLKLCWEKLRRCYNRIWSYIRRNTWIQIAIGWTLFAAFSGLCQALFQKYLIN